MASQKSPTAEPIGPTLAMIPECTALIAAVSSTAKGPGDGSIADTADAESVGETAVDFGGDGLVQKAAMCANELVKEWGVRLKPLGVRVILGGSLVSGLALPADVHDMDVRFLYDGDREKLVPKIEQATGLSFRKTITMAEGEGALGWEAHLIEGKITRDDVTFDVEGALRNTSYICWAQYYPKVMSLQELADARKRKMELRENRKAYKAFKDVLLQMVKQRVRQRGFIR